MKKDIYHFNDLLRAFNKYRRKLANLQRANKNQRRQLILKKRIEGLFEKLESLRVMLRPKTIAAGAALGAMAFIPQTSQAQVGFTDRQVNPFNIASLGYQSNSTPDFADIDGDGDLDMLTGDYYYGYDYNSGSYIYENRFKYYENIGTAANPDFAAPVINPFGIIGNNNYEENFSPSFVDIDGDGDMDIVYGDRNGNFNYLENTGTPTAPAFAAPVSNPFNLVTVTVGGGYGGSYGGQVVPSFVDIDGDGDFDLISGSLYGDFVYFENTGSVSAPDFAAPITNPFYLYAANSRSAPAFIDIDGDGDFDLLSGSSNGDFYYFENTGSSSAADFAASQMNPFNLSSAGNYSYSGNSTPTFADLDNDGDVDLMAGDGYGDFTYFRQCAPTSSSINVSTACSYIAPDGIFYNSSGTFTSVIENADGCDSTITINLTINPLADQTVTPLNPVLCGSGSTSIELGSSQDGVSYYLRDDADNSVVAGPFVGDGTNISFNTGTISSDITYNVYAENTLTRSLGLELPGNFNSNDRVDLPAINLNGASFSIEFWVKRSSTNTNDHVVSQGVANSNQGLHVGFRGNNRFTFAFFGNDLDSDNSFTDNNWHHYAVTYDVASGERIIYVDGVFEKSDISASTYTGTGNILLGDTPWGSDEFGGTMDEVRFWSGVRTQTDIQDNMNECLSGTESGLLAYYQFEDGPGSTVVSDATPNMANGNLSVNIDENVAWQEGVINCSSVCSLVMSQTPTVTVVPALVGTNTSTICNNESIVINGTTYDASNSTGTEVFTNIGPNGCDSTVTVTLNVLPAINTMTTVGGETITASLSGATYQWLDCDNGNAPISGATNQTFTATTNGDYAVEITDNGCTEVSSCVTIASTSIATADFNAQISVYPNPTNGLFQLALPETLFGNTLVLTNTTGQVIETRVVNSTLVDYDFRNLSNGIYFIQVETENGLISKKIIKN